MTADNRLDSIFGIAEQFSRIEAFAASSDEVCLGAHRLEGNYYGDAGYRAQLSMTRAGFPCSPLRNVANVFWPGSCGSYSEFHRTYVEDRDAGVLFLTTADMLQGRFDSPRYISRVLSFAGLKIQPGCMLISGSGTIGNTVIATDDFAGAYVSHDAFRVTPNNHNDLGMLYCFLQSNAGQFLLTRNKSGGVVEHIYEHDLNTLVVPMLPYPLRKELTRLIDDSCKLRVNSNRLRDEAETAVAHQNYLDQIELRSNELSFATQANEVTVAGEGRYKGAIRLDVTAHHPQTVEIRRKIAKRPHKTLGAVAEVLYIGKVFRNFIDDETRGVPLVSGKDLVQYRFKAHKVLSILDKNHIDKCRVKRGWILLSRSGNVGRTAMVHRNYEGYVASEHILRICPHTEVIDPYYLCAFLSSSYGQLQLKALQYGSVIITMSKEQLGSVVVPIPKDKGESIGNLVRAAYDSQAEARASEDRAISLFEEAIRRGRSYVEAEWGAEY